MGKNLGVQKSKKKPAVRATSPLVEKVLPWRVREVVRQMEGGSTELVRTEIVDAEKRVVISDVGGERSDADQLVRAVNCFQVMLDVLRSSVEILDVAIESREAMIGEKDDVMRDLRHQVSKAIFAAGGTP